MLFLSLGVLLAAARLLGELARRWRQPMVIGEILAGVALGPTVLGRLAPGWEAFLFPATGNLALALDTLVTVAVVGQQRIRTWARRPSHVPSGVSH